MDELIVRYLQGGVTSDEELALQTWLEESADNRRRFREMTWLWEVTAVAAGSGVGETPAAERIVHLAEERAGRAGIIPLPRRWSGALVRGAAAAAVLVLGFAIGRFASSGGPAELVATEFETASWEMATVRLNDGTIVRMAPESSLRFREQSDGREVWLDGQAFFAVAEQEGNPLRVRTRAGDASVLGTRFEVRVVDDQFRVVVVDGRVAVSNAADAVEVTAGTMALAVAGGPPAVTRVADIDAVLDWMRYSLVFQNTQLNQVVAEFERRYRVEIQIADSTLARRTVTASFSNQPFEDAFKVVCRVISARCSFEGSTALIAP